MISANFPKFRLKIDLDFSGLDFKGLGQVIDPERAMVRNNFRYLFTAKTI